MKKITKILLVGTAVTSTAIAITKNSKLNEQKKENKALTEELTNNIIKFDKLKAKNKKLSKRVINEINKIINLTDSVKGLDRSLKKDQIKLLEKIYLVDNLNSENKKLEQEQIKVKELAKEVLVAKELKVSAIKTTLIRKKINGTYTKTSNMKKIDAFKTTFKILNNDVASSGKRNIVVKVFNAKDSALNYTNKLEVDYTNKTLDIVSLIEVDREKMRTGSYKVVVFIDGKEAKSSTVNIT